MITLSAHISKLCSRRAFFRLYSAIGTLILICIMVSGLSGGSGGKEATLIFLGIYMGGILLMVLNYALIKWATLVVSMISLACFVSVELLPGWGLNPSIPVGFARIGGLIFLLPIFLTTFCWKILR